MCFKYKWNCFYFCQHKNDYSINQITSATHGRIMEVKDIH